MRTLTGPGSLIHVSAVGRGYVNVLLWTPGLTFYGAGLSYPGASYAKALMPPPHSIFCTRFSPPRKSWPSFCAWINKRRGIRRPSP